MAKSPLICIKKTPPPFQIAQKIYQVEPVIAIYPVGRWERPSMSDVKRRAHIAVIYQSFCLCPSLNDSMVKGPKKMAK